MSSKGYPKVPGVDARRFELPLRDPLSGEDYAAAMESLRSHVAEKKRLFLGYQANQRLGYAALGDLLDMQLNNLGGPFETGGFGVQSKWVERAVLDYFASLWRANRPWDSDDNESYWGYVLSMGSSEGNLYALWNAREYLEGLSVVGDDEPGTHDLILREPAEPVPSPVALCSDQTHYSVRKALRALRIDAQEVKADADGAIDIEDLRRIAEPNARQQRPMIVILNFGTTFKGAYDDVGAAVRCIRALYDEHGGGYWHNVPYDDAGNLDRRSRAWFHVDGALGAAFAPYLEGTPHQLPKFDFEAGVHSIVTSGHKWMGAPFPCGIYLSKRDYQLFPKAVDYIGAVDSTFSGSRNGLAPVVLWSYLAQTGFAGNQAKAVRLQELAEGAEATLRALDDDLGSDDLQVHRSPHSLSIVFRGLVSELTRKYSLSSERVLRDDGTMWDHYSHIFVMEHFDPATLALLVGDIRDRRANGLAVFKEPDPADAGTGGRGTRIPNSARGYSGGDG
ncbi:MAG: pyridoxal-dependent decarboxylase [Myxococcota bacterium]